METKRRESRCKGRTKAGKPCGAAATAGGLCFFHANPNKASELGRIGGRKRHAAAEGGDPLPPLDSEVAVRDRGNRLYDDVTAGKIHPRVAAVLVSLLNLQMRAICTADLEQRLAKLEQSKLRDSTSNELITTHDQESGSRAATGEDREAVGRSGGRS